MAAQLFGATVAGSLNYLAYVIVASDINTCAALADVIGGWGCRYRTAIFAAEAEAGIVRGTAASMAMYDGAFGMLVNKRFLKTPGGLMVEIGVSGRAL
jgi:hypothetical protein